MHGFMHCPDCVRDGRCGKVDALAHTLGAYTDSRASHRDVPLCKLDEKRDIVWSRVLDDSLRLGRWLQRKERNHQSPQHNVSGMLSRPLN